MSVLQGFLAVLASWWDVLCAFFASVVVYCRSGSWPSPAYDHIKSPSPASSCEEGTDQGHVDDLESGLNTAPLLLHKRVPRRSPPSSPTPPSTPGLATPATTSPVPILTSSFLSAFLLEGKGITLSPSAKAMLANGVWSADSSLSSNFGRGEFDDSEDTKVCSSPRVAFDASHRLTLQLDLGGVSIPSGTFNLDLRPSEEYSRPSPRPRPPSTVRHSLRFSMPPQPSFSYPSPEMSMDAVPSHSMSTFISLPGVNDVFRGALITEGDEVHLPSSLSSPEPRYHEFYYDYYCQEPVLALDSPTEDAIRQSILAFSPVLVIPPVPELSDLDVSFPRDEEQPLSSTPIVPSTGHLIPTPEGEKALTVVSSTSSRSVSDSWHTPLTSRRPSIDSAISASLFIFPAFASTHTAASIATANEVQEGSRQGAERTALVSSSSSSSFYADSDTGSTSRELGDDSNRTLQTPKHEGYRKTDSNLSSSSEGTRSLSGSEGSLEMSGEVALVQVKRGSIVRPVVLVRSPGTRESLTPLIDECDFPDGSPNGTATAIAPRGKGTADQNLAVSDYPSGHPPPIGQERLKAFDGDEEEEGSIRSEDESSVEWLKWPHRSKQEVGPQIEEIEQSPVQHNVPEIIVSPSPSATVFNANHRRTANASRGSNPPTIQHNLRQLIVSHIQDFIPVKLPRYHHQPSKGSSLASTTSTPPQASPTSGSFLRSSIVIQMDSAQVPMVGGIMAPPQTPFADLDGLGDSRSFGVSLTFNADAAYPATTFADSRYPTFIQAATPFPNPKRSGRARAKTLPTRLRNAFGGGNQDAHEEDIGSSGSSDTVNAGQVRDARIAADSRLKAGGAEKKPQRMTRRRRRGTDAADRGLEKPRRTFIAAGEDSGQDDVPSDYSGARAL